jgi:hypothetical protein
MTRIQPRANAPHVTRELAAVWALAAFAMLAGAWLLLSREFDEAGWLGGLVVNVMGLVVGAGITLLLLHNEIGIGRQDSGLAVFRWLQYLRGKPADHTVRTADITRVTIAWPLECRVEAAGESIRFSTFLWRPHHYVEFERFATELGLEIHYDRPILDAPRSSP